MLQRYLCDTTQKPKAPQCACYPAQLIYMMQIKAIPGPCQNAVMMFHISLSSSTAVQSGGGKTLTLPSLLDISYHLSVVW